MPATYTAPRTWVVGELVTAAYLNTHLRDMMEYFYSKRLDILHYQDQKTSGTAADNITQATWATRVLNTEVVDTGNFGTLASNQVSLLAGNYLAFFTGNINANVTHQMRLRNVTDSETLATSKSNGASLGANTIGMGRFTISATKTIELQHWHNNGGATAGGAPVSTGTNEVYADLLLIRLGD